MVLKKVILCFFICVFNLINIYAQEGYVRGIRGRVFQGYEDYISGAQYLVSGLLQHNFDVTAQQQLELVEEKTTVSFLSGGYSFYNSILSEYTIKNTGVEISGEIGIFVWDMELKQGEPSYIKEKIKDFPLYDLEFRVNGQLVPYQVSKEEQIEAKEGGGGITVRWALIPVRFAINSETIINVSYNDVCHIDDVSTSAGFLGVIHNEFDYSRLASPDWKGNPKYSLTIKNNAVDNDHSEDWLRGFGKDWIEVNWITHVNFYTKDAGYLPYPNPWKGNLSEMLQKSDSLSNDFYTLQKIDAATWKIECTDKFNDFYNRGFRIGAGSFTGEAAFHYCNLFGDQLRMEVYDWYADDFDSDNISNRKLAPFELFFLTNTQLRVMRNAFYARHGYIFKDEKLTRFFLPVYGGNGFFYPESGFNYRENPGFNEAMLTDIDRANIEIIQRLETMFEN